MPHAYTLYPSMIPWPHNNTCNSVYHVYVDAIVDPVICDGLHIEHAGRWRPFPLRLGFEGEAVHRRGQYQFCLQCLGEHEGCYVLIYLIDEPLACRNVLKFLLTTLKRQGNIILYHGNLRSPKSSQAIEGGESSGTMTLYSAFCSICHLRIPI